MIDFQNVSKSFACHDILSDASFRINSGERVGIVGPNGAGKSTLFNLITGELSPDAGVISCPGNIRISCLHQHTVSGIAQTAPLTEYVADALPRLSEIRTQLHALEADPQLLRDPQNLNLHGELQHEWEALGGYRLETDAKIALAGLGFRSEDEHRLLGTFSGGWQMRAALARVLIADPDVLLLDEPSNYLDVPAIEWLDRFLSNFRGTLLLISHDRYLLRTLVDTILEVNAGKTTRYNCGYNDYVAERAQRTAIAENQRKNLAKQREHIQTFVDRFRSKASKASAVQSSIKALEKLDADIPSLPENLSYASGLILPDPPHCGTQLVALRDAGFAYQSGKWIFRHAELEINHGDKIAVVGYNGMGKTTLLRTLSGIRPLTEGLRTLGHKVILGYQAQEFTDILPPEKSVFDVVRSALPPNGDSRNIRSLLGAFGFSGDNVDKPVKVLSGGEKIRLCFARIFVNPPNLLILDEPTTHLDLQARETLQQAIIDYKGTVILVSHDIEFLRQTATHILAVTPTGIKRYYGNYDEYMQKIRNPVQKIESTPIPLAVNPVKTEDPKERRRQRADQRQQMSREKQRLEKAIYNTEQQIDKAETEKNTLIDQLASPSANTDFAALSRRQKELQILIDSATAEWESHTEAYGIFMLEWNALSE